MTTSPIERVLDRLATVERPIARMWERVISSDDLSTTPMSMKNFVENHDMLETLQVKFDDTGKIIELWAPGPREVDASHASYVKLDGSRRDYAGVVHMAHNDETWIGYDSEFDVMVAYTTI